MSELLRAAAVQLHATTDREANLAEQAKPGIGRLALQSGAPVVPIAILGSAKIRNWKRGRFTKVVVRYGKPLRFTKIDNPTREQQQHAADQILLRIREMHAELEQAGPKRAAAVARESVLAER